MLFPVIFRFISGEISAEKNFSNIFIAPKDSSLNFRGSLFSYFWAIMLIFAVITIIEDFGSLLPARTVTVKEFQKHDCSLAPPLTFDNVACFKKAVWIISFLVIQNFSSIHFSDFYFHNFFFSQNFFIFLFSKIDFRWKSRGVRKNLFGGF